MILPKNDSEELFLGILLENSSEESLRVLENCSESLLGITLLNNP